MKSGPLCACLLLSILLSCRNNLTENSQQYAAYTLRAEGAYIYGYKTLAADGAGIFAVTTQNETYKLDQDFSRSRLIYLPPAQIEKVSSVMVRNGRLYVSSWSDSNSRNLVLSLDIEGGGKTVQIGNGSYGYTHDAANGSGPWHPQAVYAGQNYLYVAATGQNIRVYRLADVLGSGWKNTTAPFCYLKTGLAIEKNSRVTMQERNGDLFIVSDSSDAVCRYNTALFTAGTAAAAIEPEQRVSGLIRSQRLRTFSFGKTKAAAAAGKYVYIYALPDFLSLSFDNPLMIFSSADDNGFDKIRNLCDLREDADLSFTALGDWGLRTYTAIKYDITARGGLQ